MRKAAACRQSTNPRSSSYSRLEPGVLVLLADVLVPAEHERRVERRRRVAAATDLPLDQLVPGLADHVAEELGADERAVDDREHAHRRQP